MRIELEVYVICVNNKGEEIPPPRVTPEEIKGWIKHLIDQRIETLADARQGFTFISLDPPTPHR